MLYGYGVYGQDILSYSAMSLSSIHNSTGEFQNCLQEYISNAWTPENHSTKYARMTVSDNNKNTRVSDAWIKKVISSNFKIFRSVIPLIGNENLWEH